MLAGCGLRSGRARVRWVRLEAGPLGEVDLDEWSGIILGGGPYNVATPRTRSRRPSAGPRPTRTLAAGWSRPTSCSSAPATASACSAPARRGRRPDLRRAHRRAARRDSPTRGGTTRSSARCPRRFDGLPRSQGGGRVGCLDGAVLLASTDNLPGPRLPDRPATSTPPSSTPSSTPSRILRPDRRPTAPTATTSRTSREHLKAAAREDDRCTEPVRLLARFVELYART